MQTQFCLTLEALRTAKKVPSHEVASMLSLDLRDYEDIESGKKKPTIDTLRDLAAMYGTSMDFMYGAYYQKSVTYSSYDGTLDYAFRCAKAKDLLFIGTWTTPPDAMPPPVFVPQDWP